MVELLAAVHFAQRVLDERQTLTLIVQSALILIGEVVEDHPDLTTPLVDVQNLLNGVLL